MKAAVYRGPYQLKAEDYLTPEIADDEVLVEVHYCGICGTDIHLFEGDPGSAQTDPPVILGHEFSGKIAKIGLGEESIDFSIGDKVTCDVNTGCGYCIYCKKGQASYCLSMEGIGTRVDGAFANYIKVKKNMVYRVHDDVDLRHLALAEPLSCCIHGIDLVKPKIGTRAIVFGAGSIGLVMLQLLKHAGVAAVYSVEPDIERRTLAKEYSDCCFDPLSEDLLDYFTQEENKVDYVFDCAGVGASFQQGLKVLRKGGTLMYFAVSSPSLNLELNAYQFFAREYKIMSSFVNPNCFDRAVAALENKMIDANGLIGRVYPLSSIEDVFLNKLYKIPGKVLVDCRE